MTDADNSDEFSVYLRPLFNSVFHEHSNGGFPLPSPDVAPAVSTMALSHRHLSDDARYWSPS